MMMMMMLFSLLKPVFITFIFTSFQVRRSVAVVNILNLENDKIIPDVIPTSPELVLEVKYDKNVSVVLGNEITPTQAQDEPVSLYWKSDPKEFYLICLIDPDYPDPKNRSLGQWKHWLVVNIPGNDVKKGHVLAEYVGPVPHRETGLHRYVFLAYKQPEKLEYEEKPLNCTSRVGRTNFNIANYAKKYILGKPIAANFFKAKFDEFVPYLYQQIA